MDDNEKTGLVLTGGGARAAYQAGMPHAPAMIAPSERPDDIALRHVHSLPAPLRTLPSKIGTLESRGAASASCLLFEGGHTRELIRLGEHDSLARRDDMLAFFPE